MINPYLPATPTIAGLNDETSETRPIKPFRVVLGNGKDFNHRPGQCAIIGILGTGESMISIASSPTRTGYLEFSVMKLRSGYLRPPCLRNGRCHFHPGSLRQRIST